MKRTKMQTIKNIILTACSILDSIIWKDICIIIPIGYIISFIVEYMKLNHNITAEVIVSLCIFFAFLYFGISRVLQGVIRILTQALTRILFAEYEAYVHDEFVCRSKDIAQKCSKLDKEDREWLENL